MLIHKGQYPLVGERVDTPAGNLPVGSVIQLNENGSPVDYLVVNQGNPGTSLYGEDCNGAWVIRLESTDTQSFSSESNNFATSSILQWLNNEFIGRFDEQTKSAIKQVKIPYWNSGSTASLENGVSCKVFLPSIEELGVSIGNFDDGLRLQYFEEGTGDSAVGLRKNSQLYWTRSPFWSNLQQQLCCINETGITTNRAYTGSNTTRPMFILDPSATVKAYPTCAFVVGMKDCMNELRAINGSNKGGGWNDCEMRTWLHSDVGFKGAFPADLLPIFKQMRVLTASGAGDMSPVESLDNFALAAEKEVFGINTHASAMAEAGLFQFEWYKTESNRPKRYGPSSTSVWYFDRSPSLLSSNRYCYVDYDGTTGITEQTSPGGVAVFGCI